jgi:phosphoenolpyruvate carboxykinase (GTP)
VKSPPRREDVRRRGVPERLRQDELRDAGPAEGLRGLEDLTTVGDDIAWIKPGKDGRSTRSTPRPASSASRRAPNDKTNPNAMATMTKNTIFTNVALTDDGDVWWEGMTTRRRRTSSTGRATTGRPSRPKRGAPERALHGARRAVPVDRPGWEDPAGVPISAFIFGGRRQDMPLVYQAFNWSSACTSAATMGSEMTAAAAGRRRAPRPVRDAAVLRLQHGRLLHALAQRGPQGLENPPRIFRVNWFRKDENGKFLWPGFGENMRVLKWIVDRVRGRAYAIESPLGWMPRYEDLDWKGLDFPRRPSTS